MLMYILKSTACLVILFLFYKLFLERESIHIFKRFYLLAALLLALSIPAMVFTEYVEAPAETFVMVASKELPIANDIINVPQALESDIVDIAPILWTIYFLGLLFFGIKFLKNLFQIFRRIRINPKQKIMRFTQVLLQEEIPPHTFFSYIFLNKKKLEANDIPKEVLLHEETHARQKHSWDVVFVEALQVIFWINPFIYLTKKAIKLNHEFLADQAVLKKDIDKITYQNTLLSYLSPDSEKKYQPSLANAINYSSIKKRFTVMKKITSRKSVLLRTFLLIPLLATLLYGFSGTKIVQKQKTAQQMGPSEIFKEQHPDQEGTTDEQTKEYNLLAKKYNAMLQQENIRIKMSDVERLEYLHGLMTHAQRENAEPFPDFPEPPPMTDAPIPPKPPKAKKGEKGDIPPPPPPPRSPDKSEKEIAGEIVQEIIANQDPYDLNPRKQMFSKGEVVDFPSLPPSPPEPVSPLDHVIEMAKKDATFYYEGKKISSDKAIQLLKKNKSLNIDSRGANGNRPTVRISRAPIKIGKVEKPSQPVPSSDINVKTGNIETNGKSLFYSTKNGVTSYFNSLGEQVDERGKLLAQHRNKNPKFYYNGKQISSEKANRLLSSNTSIQVTNEEYSDEEYAIILTDLNNPNAGNPNFNNNPNSAIDLTQVISKGAVFFYNDEPISTEKALWLTQNEYVERVQVKEGRNKQPKVFFWNNN